MKTAKTLLRPAPGLNEAQRAVSPHGRPLAVSEDGEGQATFTEGRAAREVPAQTPPLPSRPLGFQTREARPAFTNPMRDPALVHATDGLHYFRDELPQRIRAGERFIIFTDFDNTMVDTVEGRHRHVMEGIDATHGTRFAERYRRDWIGGSWQETAQRLKLDAWQTERFGWVWYEKFFDPNVVATDKVMEPIAQLFRDLGAPLEVITGRQKLQDEVTRRQLERAGFPDARLHLKPDDGYDGRDGTATFKVEVLKRRIAELNGEGGPFTFLFVTESRADTAAINAALNDVVETVLLDTTFERDTTPVAPGTPTLPPLITHPPEPLLELIGALRPDSAPLGDPLLARVELWLDYAEATRDGSALWGLPAFHAEPDTPAALATLREVLLQRGQGVARAQSLAQRLSALL